MNRIRFNPVLNPPVSAESSKGGQEVSGAFADVLQGTIDRQQGVSFSKHAAQRLQSRSIELSRQDLQKLNSAVDRASQKGIQDSLVLLGQVAYIVDVPGKTVVTAVPVNETEENIFTNIDGAVIA